MSVVAATRDVVETFRDENVPFKSASIAYYGLASFIPAIVLGLTLLSMVGLSDLLVETLQRTLATSGIEGLDAVLRNTEGRRVAGLLGLILTVWSASKVFRGLAIAFEDVYDVDRDLSLLVQLAKSLLVIAVLVVAFVFVSAAMVIVELQSVSVYAGNVLTLVLIGVAFYPFYYVLPPTSVSVRHAIPGTVVAAVGWALLQVVFFYYVEYGGGFSAYGILGTVLVFVTFLYFAANVLLLGAVVNAVVEW